MSALQPLFALHNYKSDCAFLVNMLIPSFSDQHVLAVQDLVCIVPAGSRERNYPPAQTRPLSTVRNAGVGHRLMAV